MATKLAALTLVLVGCASLPAPRPDPKALDQVLRRIQCEHAALSVWDGTELRRLAETCGPRVRDCEEALGRHVAKTSALEVAVAAGYRAARMAAEKPSVQTLAAASAAELGAREALRAGGVDVEACR